MATFYLDYDGGSDAADGLSFANRWKTFTLGATAARIAPGDTIRVMGSPAPTSLAVTGVWTDRTGGLASTQTITSSTNATPIVITFVAHGRSNGDTIVVTGHATNTNANGTWEVAGVTADTYQLVGSTGNGVGGATGSSRLRNNSRVTLSAALTKNIACCQNRGEVATPTRAVWTASANVTTSHSTTDFKSADVSDSIAVAAGFTTGLAAYFTLGLDTDFSAYKQVSFWIKQTAGTVAVAGDVSLRLCTDTVGAVSANTIAVPRLVALNQWVPIAIDTGAALTATGNSIAFYVDADKGAQTFLISNIIACKDSTLADSLSQTSLLGKNTGTETWYGIQSINGTRVILDMINNTIPTTTTWRGYSGVTETVTTHKRETIKVIPLASGAIGQEVMDLGTVGSLISFEGGWDRTAMTTQNLETWFDGQNGLGDGIYISAKPYISLNLINTVRYGTGVFLNSNNNTVTTTCNNCNTAGVFLSSSNNNTVTATGNNSGGNAVLINSGNNNVITTATGNNCGSNAVLINSGNNNVITTATGNNCGSNGVSFVACTNNVIFSGSASGNGSASVSGGNGINYFRNFTMGNATEVTGLTAFSDARIYSEKHDGTTDNHQIFCDGGLINSNASVRQTASGISWAFAPTSTNRSSTYPLDLSIAKVACAASALVTIKAWMRRTNTALTMRLVCKGGQLSGVAADVTASMTAVADTWEELTITFTPTEAGVVEITAEAYGGTTHTGYVDNMTVTQA